MCRQALAAATNILGCCGGVLPRTHTAECLPGTLERIQQAGISFGRPRLIGICFGVQQRMGLPVPMQAVVMIDGQHYDEQEGTQG